MKLINKFVILILFLTLFLTGCLNAYGSVKIVNGDITIEIGETKFLDIKKTNIEGQYIFSSDNDNVIVSENGKITGNKIGTSKVTVEVGEYYDSITVTVIENKYQKKLIINGYKEKLVVLETLNFKTSYYVNDVLITDDVKCDYIITSGENNCTLENGIFTAKSKGKVTLYAIYEGIKSENITIEVFDKDLISSVILTVSTEYPKIGEKVNLNIKVNNSNISNYNYYYQIENQEMHPFVLIEGNYLISTQECEIILYAYVYDETSGSFVKSNAVNLKFTKNTIKPTRIIISSPKEKLLPYETYQLYYAIIPGNARKDIKFYVLQGNATINDKFELTCFDDKEIIVIAVIDDVESNELIINKSEEIKDPYINYTYDEFYSNYKPSNSYQDSVFRTNHGFMSGDITLMDQAPTICNNRPQENNLYIKNTSMLYSADKNIYYVIDSFGKITREIYKGAAYITLEEVSAYIFAYNDVPANYTENKSGKPSKSIWGEFLRVNHTYFSGDIDRYPYEPILPDINGCGGNLNYFELDIGTTGTDCDPNYPTEIYNDGYKITRGAARIVYSRYDENGNDIQDINKKYLFYTYNHYNDFQEYLNYENGWGEMFGNITGGGVISSREYYNPTKYINIKLEDLYNK